MMGILIKRGARLSIKNLSKCIPVKLCTVKDQLKPVLAEINANGLKLIDAIKKGRMDIMEKLIAKGVDIDLEYYDNKEGKTPMMEAIISGRRSIATMLDLKGADVSGTTANGMTLREYGALNGITFFSTAKDQLSRIAKKQKLVHEWLQENPPKNEIEKQQKQNGHALTFQAYHRLDDIYSFMRYLAKKYSKLCKLIKIGETHEGRPLLMLRISNGKVGNKAIWIDGGIHAREWITPAAVAYIANDLLKTWTKQSPQIQCINWHIVVVLNPDGYEFSHQNGNRFWQKNRNSKLGGDCIGVDLNRNFGHYWVASGSFKDQCNENYSGLNAFSEPETEAVRRFFNGTNEKFCGFLSFQSFGESISFKKDLKMPIFHGERLNRIGLEGVKQMNEVANQSYSMNPELRSTGSPDGWARSIGVKYAYTVGLRDMGRYGYLLPVGQIVPTAQEAQAFVRTVSKAIFEDVRNKSL